LTKTKLKDILNRMHSTLVQLSWFRPLLVLQSYSTIHQMHL